MPSDDVRTDEPKSLQGILTDNFFYFFLKLRKGRIRSVVAAINERFSEETIEQRARRLIGTQTPLSFIGGALAELPMMIPGVGQALGLLGLFGGASILIRMHLYLILEIALLYGKDIEDEDRVPEMVAVVLATGIAAGAPLLIRTMGANPLLALPAGGLTCAGAAQLIGESAIRFYSQGQVEAAPPEPLPA
jgi:hypothetical protein